MPMTGVHNKMQPSCRWVARTLEVRSRQPADLCRSAEGIIFAMIYVNPYDAPESVPRSPVPFSWRESGRGTLLYSAPFPIAILLVNFSSGVPLWDCISTLLSPDSSFPLLACAATYAIAFYWLIGRSRRLHGWVHLASGFIEQRSG
jgi:hypothetical protein